MDLLPIIRRYIDASNAHDVESILACFADDGVVRDENETLRGQKAIEEWISGTIQKYKFQFQTSRYREPRRRRSRHD